MFQSKNDKKPSVGRPAQSFSSAIVFGAAHGIGKAIEESLFQEKASVLISIDRDSSFKDESVINPEGGRYRLFSDITDLDTLRQVTRGISNRSLELAVFNAGIQQNDDRARTFAVNVEGTKNCFTVSEPLLKPQATVVFLSSDLITMQGQDSVYVESKRAVAEFAEEVAREYPGLRVLILLPGPVKTALFERGKSEELLSRIEHDCGIFSPEEFTRMLFEEVLPEFSAKQSGSMVRMYKRAGFEWVEYP